MKEPTPALPRITALAGVPASAVRERAAVRGIWMGWGVFLACWAAAATATLALGRDANHDLRNYHYYNAYALAASRWAMDLAPAGPHSFLHPGLDLPFYLLTQSSLNGWPRIVGALQAGYAGLLAFLTLALANLACHGEARRATAASALVAAFGLTGAATLPEAGTTCNDIQIACFVIGALLALLLAAAGEAGGTSRGRPWMRQASGLRLLAGVLGGAALGFKLTAIVFPPALALVAAVVAPPGAVARARAVGLLAAGGALGFAAVYGPWGWFLYERFGNPFGPFFNDVFRSAWFVPETLRDTRFLPAGLAEALAYPLLWAGPPQAVTTEPAIADPRFALGLASLLLAAGVGAWRYGRRGRTPVEISAWAVMVFCLVAYAAWLPAFAYLRYAIPIEVLLGVPVHAAARVLLAGMPGGGEAASADSASRRHGAAACVGAALGCCVLITQYPSWKREPFGWDRDPRGEAAVAAERVRLPHGSLVAMVGNQVSFVAPFLDGPGVRFVGATMWAATGDAYAAGGAARLGTHRLAAEVSRVLQSHPGPVFVVLENPETRDDDLPRLDVAVVRAFGIEFDRGSCRPVANNLTTWVQICRWR